MLFFPAAHLRLNAQSPRRAAGELSSTALRRHSRRFVQ
jgi:hypothetical protein